MKRCADAREYLIFLLTGGHEEEIDPEKDSELIGLRAHKSTLARDTLTKIFGDIEQLQEQDEKRKETIESKAVTLIGSITLATSFIVGLSQVSSNSSSYSNEIKVIVIVINICIGICLLITITFALRATLVGKYKFALPSLEDYWDDNNKSKTDTEIEHSRAVTALYIYIRNREIINSKATHVIHAQRWFKWTIFLLFLLIMLMGIPPILSSNQAEPVTPEAPIMVIVVTTTATASDTPSPTSTQTIVVTPTPVASLAPTIAPGSTALLGVTPTSGTTTP